MREGRAASARQSDPSPALLNNTMCLMGQPQPQAPAVLALPPKVRDADDAKAFSATLDAMATRRPSWTTLRGVFKQPSSTGRPGLPRRFHTKINLNEYWGALEKVVKVEVSWPRLRPAAAAANKEAMDVDNEVNDNLANERTEAEQTSKMDVDDDKAVVAEVHHVVLPPSPHKNVAHVEVQVAEVKVPEVKSTGAKVADVKAADITLSRRSASAVKKSRRRSLPAPPRPPPPCGAPTAAPACHRVPLGTINGLDSRAQLRKSLSPLSVFADNLARRLARQH